LCERVAALAYRLRRRTSLALGIAVVAMTVWLVGQQPSTNCNDGTWPNADGHVILASKVVVHPWYGPHHVYGIFVIPSQYDDQRYSVTVSVRGVNEQAALGERSENVHGNIITTEPGHYVEHAHLRTRVALRSFVTGRFGDLRAPCNWALVFTNKS